MPSEELRELEARMDARLQGVNARFSTADRRHDSLSSQLGISEDQRHDFAEQVKHRFGAVEDRFDATDRRIDVVYDKLASKIDQAAKRQARVSSTRPGSRPPPLPPPSQRCCCRDRRADRLRRARRPDPSLRQQIARVGSGADRVVAGVGAGTPAGCIVVSGELLLRLYVFAIVGASVAWVLEVAWLAVGRAVWRRLLRIARSARRSADG